MKFLIEILVAPIQPLIWHPERILVVALLFVLMSFYCQVQHKPIWPTVITAAGWALYAAWEWHCRKMGYNIRVDLGLIVPVLYSLTLWGILHSFWSRNEKSNASHQA